jgi:hypothetical protein
MDWIERGHELSILPLDGKDNQLDLAEIPTVPVLDCGPVARVRISPNQQWDRPAAGRSHDRTLLDESSLLLSSVNLRKVR